MWNTVFWKWLDPAKYQITITGVFDNRFLLSIPNHHLLQSTCWAIKPRGTTRQIPNTQRSEWYVEDDKKDFLFLSPRQPRRRRQIRTNWGRCKFYALNEFLPEEFMMSCIPCCHSMCFIQLIEQKMSMLRKTNKTKTKSHILDYCTSR